MAGTSRSGTHAVLAAALLALPMAAGCREPPQAHAFFQPASDTMRVAAGLSLAGQIESLHGPESVRYDPDQDIYFISNMMGPGSARDGAGYITRVAAATLAPIDNFIEGGREGVVLNAPKGMTLQGDTLWVADIDVVRGFHRITGQQLRTIAFSFPITLLNDVAAGPDGVLYVTDTGIAMTEKGVIKRSGDRVLAVHQDGRVAVRADASQIGWPNGVTWDAARSRWLVASFDPFGSTLHALSGDGGPATPVAVGVGRFDGVEVLADGTILVTCWKDNALHMITTDGTHSRLIGELTQPADIGIDTRRNRVAIPQPLRGVVAFWNLPPLAATTAAH